MLDQFDSHHLDLDRSDHVHLRRGEFTSGGHSCSLRKPIARWDFDTSLATVHLHFTGQSCEQHGYADGWRDVGVFLYTGEGQVGDISFVRGNAALREHSEDRKEFLFFEALGKSRPVRFMVKFACQSWDTFRGPNREGNERECIQFHLVRIASGAETPNDQPIPAAKGLSICELRRRTREAAKPKQAKKWTIARTGYRERSKAVRDYVLARAGGIRELTGQAAQFLNKAGDPYLEVHHSHRLSDDGPDDSVFVAAIGPNVHREIHNGANGPTLDGKLQDITARKEAALEAECVI